MEPLERPFYGPGIGLISSEKDAILPVSAGKESTVPVEVDDLKPIAYGPQETYILPTKTSSVSLAQMIEQKKREIEHFQTEIDQAKSAGTLLNKIKSLKDVEDKVLNVKKFVSSIDSEIDSIKTKKEELLAEISSLKKAEQMTEQLENEISLKEKSLQQMTKQSEEIEKIKPDKTMVSLALEQVQASLELLNKITLVAAGIKVEVSLKNLIESSQVFKKLYESEMAENQSQELFLKFDEPVNQKDVQAFLQFFQSHEIALTADNVMSLFHLANQFAVAPLLKQCFEFLQENASLDSFPHLLQMGVETNQSELIWIAIHLGMQDPQSLAKSENFKNFSNQTKAILNDLKALAELKKPFHFHPILGKIEVNKYSVSLSLLKNLSQLIPISLEIKKNISTEDFESLANKCPLIEHLILSCSSDPNDKLKKFPKLKSFGNTAKLFKSIEEFEKYQKELSPIVLNVLDLTQIGDNLQDSDLKKVSENLPDLKQLFIQSSKITSIPFKGLEHISCRDCTSLTSLNVPNATKVCCRGCTSLASLNVPNATEVDCRDCTFLASLTAPNATKVNCSGCNSLTSLTAPNATEVNCSRCTFLASLTAPNATRVDCPGCTSLASLTAPNAIEVDCPGCTLLASLTAPYATRVDCPGCSSLTSLTAPYATRVDCSGCTLLASLTAANATSWIYCSGCSSLTSLTVPNATWVDCSRCTSLASLTAPNATEVYCRDCSSLASLTAPNATKVDCRGCRPDIKLSMPAHCEIVRD